MPSVFGLKGMIAAFLVALVIGASTGGWALHAYYAPRLALALVQVDALGVRIAEQNAGIEKQLAAEKDRAAAAKKALAAAQAEADRAQADVLGLLQRTPPVGIDVCKAASDLITEELSK